MTVQSLSERSSTHGAMSVAIPAELGGGGGGGAAAQAAAEVDALEAELAVMMATLGSADCSYITELGTLRRWVGDAERGGLAPPGVRFVLAVGLPRALEPLLGRPFAVEGAEDAVRELLLATAGLLARSLVTPALGEPSASLLRRLMNPRLHFFARLGHPPGTVLELAAEVSEAWRAHAGFASHVDALLAFDDGSNRWHRAQIVEESETQFKLHFANQSERCDKWVERDSPDIAAEGSKVGGDADAGVAAEWATSLREGSLVDVRDDVNYKWYNGTVTSARNSMMYRDVQVAYRVYMANGDHEDPVRGRYRGYANKPPELISVDNRAGRSRLAKLCTKAVPPQAVVSQAPVDDAGDAAGVFAVRVVRGCGQVFW